MRNTRRSRFGIVRLLTMATALICFTAATASAGVVRYWVGGDGGDWAVAANWSTNTAPQQWDWDTPTFDNRVTAAISTVSNADYSFDKIAVEAGSKAVSVSGTGLFRFGGGGISIADTGGNLSIANTVTVEGNNQKWIVGSGRTLTFSGRVNGNNFGGDQKTAVKQGTGTLVLSGTADNDSLKIAVEEGTVELNKTDSNSGHSPQQHLKNQFVRHRQVDRHGQPANLRRGRHAPDRRHIRTQWHGPKRRQPLY